MLLDVTIIDGLFHFMSTKNSLLVPTRKLAAAVSGAVLGLAGIFFLIMVALNLFKMMIGEGKQNFNFLWKYFALLMALGLYTTLMPIVDSAINMPLAAVKKAAGSTTGQGMSAMDLDKAIAASNDKSPMSAAATQALANSGGTNPFAVLDPRNYGKILLTGIIQSLYSIVLCVLVFVQVYAIAILYVTGPIAIAWSIMLGFEGSLLGWLKYYVVIKMWAILIYVIEGLSTLLLANSIDSASGLGSYEALIIQGGLILVYCMVPKFADILISGSQSGSFFSAAIAAASKGISSSIAPAATAASQYMGGRNLGQFGSAASSALGRLGQSHGQNTAAGKAMAAASNPGGTKLD